MKKLLAALLLGALIPASTNAQVGFGGMLPGPGTVHSAGGGGGYSGPGDQGVTYLVWGGAYAYSAAKRGSAALRICNSGDANCADVNSDATTGIVPNPTLGGFACDTSSHKCTVSKVYNQGSGGSTYDAAQSSEGSRPAWVPNCSGLGSNIGCLVTTGSEYMQTGTFTSSQPISMTMIANMDAGTSGAIIYYTDGTDNSGAGGGWFGNPNLNYCYAGSGVTDAATDGSWFSQSCVLNLTSSIIAINGASLTGQDIGIRTAASAITVPNGFSGKIASYGIATSAFNSTNISDIYAANETILGL